MVGELMFINKISESKRNTFKQCRLKYQYRYINRIDETANNNTDALHFGSYIHKILEEGYKATTYSELDQLAKMYRKDYSFSKAYENKIERCLKNFLRFNASLQKTRSVEEYFELDMDNDIQIIGYIDRIIEGNEGGFLIIDYKTGKREKDKVELFQDTQLKGYVYATHKIYDVPIEKIVAAHYYPVTDNFVSVKYSQGQVLTHVRSVIEDVWKIRKLKKEDFPPQKNEFCNWCGYKNICTLFNDACSIKKIIEEAKTRNSSS
jgi:CRISPR/Cas system-associated exonuclease Cas4 (RecB family)